jgi:ATP-dependent Clp protease adaptor protein ClpS
MIFEPEIEEEVDVLIKEVTAKTKVIILYNDDYNTFDHVINCLVKYCKHDPIQAEQCALLVHHTGRCDVKHGSYDKLKLC